MWESLVKIATNLVDFARGTKRNADDLKKTNARVDELSGVLLSVLMRVDSMEKMEAKERQILVLQLKNLLLEHGIKPSALGESIPELPSDEPEKGASH